MLETKSICQFEEQRVFAGGQGKMSVHSLYASTMVIIVCICPKNMYSFHRNINSSCVLCVNKYKAPGTFNYQWPKLSLDD